VRALFADDLLRPLRQMVRFQLGRGSLADAEVPLGTGSLGSPTSPDPRDGDRGVGGVEAPSGGVATPSLWDAPVRESAASGSHVKAAAPHRRQRHGVVPWRQRPFASLALPATTATTLVPSTSPGAALDGPGSESS
jgi:hypothetical protein